MNESLASKNTEVVPPQLPVPFVRMNRERLGEMIEQRRREMIEKESKSTLEGTHTRFRNLAASEPGEERPPRELNKNCKTQSPASPDTSPSPLKPRTQWMIENDPRTEEQADADWRRVTESLFGTNTRAEPKTVGESWGEKDEKIFSPKWGNLPVTQELKDEEKRWADFWKRRRLDSDRLEADKQRKRGGSPVRGNRSSKSTFLDEIDDPHGR